MRVNSLSRDRVLGKSLNNLFELYNYVLSNVVKDLDRDEVERRKGVEVLSDIKELIGNIEYLLGGRE